MSSDLRLHPYSALSPYSLAQLFDHAAKLALLGIGRDGGGCDDAPIVLKSISIKGLRGFAHEQTLDLAIPTGESGSGLTVIVGPNGGGKSTIVEALRAITQTEPPSFAKGRRNTRAGDAVKLTLSSDAGERVIIESVIAGSSETQRTATPGHIALGHQGLFVLPSRRTFSPYFGKGLAVRDNYMVQLGFPALRTSSLDQFSSRLFEIQSHREDFDAVMKRVLDPVPAWTIDQQDTGQYYLSVKNGGTDHTSDGLGEGIVSLIFLIDALYDSTPGQTIVIDEPELSLHPALQRRLATLFTEYAQDRQIICSTHSTYFINIPAVANGGVIARVHLRDGASKISSLRNDTAKRIAALLSDTHNPHVLGLNAQEAFFLEDGIVLLEGQEDVVYFSRVEASLGISLQGNLYGWGVGGADKMELITKLLRELGFQKVAGILDGDKRHVAESLRSQFSEYLFSTIPADDIRSKKSSEAKKEVVGLLDANNREVRSECAEPMRKLMAEANAYLSA